MNGQIFSTKSKSENESSREKLPFGLLIGEYEDESKKNPFELLIGDDEEESTSLKTPYEKLLAVIAVFTVAFCAAGIADLGGK